MFIPIRGGSNEDLGENFHDYLKRDRTAGPGTGTTPVCRLKDSLYKAFRYRSFLGPLVISPFENKKSNGLVFVVQLCCINAALLMMEAGAMFVRGIQ